MSVEREHEGDGTRTNDMGMQKMTIRWLLLASLLAATSVGATSAGMREARAGEPARPDAVKDRSAEVGKLFKAAQAAVARKDYQAAYDAYQAAWALQKSYDIAGNLASVELQLGKRRDAAEHFSFALRSFPPTGEPRVRDALALKLEQVAMDLSRVRVRVSVDGATVLVNGKEVGASPIGEELFVEPGAVTFEARRDGYEEARVAVVAEAGAFKEVALALEPARREGAAVGPAAAPPVPLPTRGELGGAPAERSRVPAYVIGGAGGVALVGGLVLLGVAESKRSSAEALSEETGHACPVGEASPRGKCGELSSAASGADAFGNVGLGALVVAGAAAVGVTVYLLWPAPRDEKAVVRVRAAPFVGVSSGGVAVTGSF